MDYFVDQNKHIKNEVEKDLKTFFASAGAKRSYRRAQKLASCPKQNQWIRSVRCMSYLLGY